MLAVFIYFAIIEYDVEFDNLLFTRRLPMQHAHTIFIELFLIIGVL